jgi:N-acetyl sugar amidotransferase
MKMPRKVCAKTVMDSSDPSFVVDDDGISNHYWEFQNVLKPYWLNSFRSQDKLNKIVSQIKKSGKGREFNCILGLSGGLDSSYMLHKLVTEFHLRPLVFHVDGGWNSEESVNNIAVMVDKLNLDLFTEVIHWEEMRDFQLAMFKSGVPHLDVPQDMAFTSVLYKFAAKHEIKYILSGGNVSTECVQTPVQLLYWGTDMAQVRDICDRYGSIPMPTYPFSNILYHKLYLRFLRGVKVVKPLNLMPYLQADAINELERAYGWKPYPQKHFESRFTRFFEGYWLPTRFGYDMRRRNFSSLILTNQMKRSEALARLETPPYSPETLEQEFAYIAMKLGISTDELCWYHEMPKKFYWDYRNQKQLFDLGEKILNKMTGDRRGGSL